MPYLRRIAQGMAANGASSVLCRDARRRNRRPSIGLAVVFSRRRVRLVCCGMVAGSVAGIERGIRQHTEKDFFNEFSLMLIASIGAFAIGEYPEGVAVMLFYSIGEALQDKAVARARRNISALVDMRPKEATVVRGGKAESVPPESIAVGEEIIVKTGERVPLDGVLLDRDAVFDTAALTGESMPRRIKRDETVLAGMLPTSSATRLRVAKNMPTAHCRASWRWWNMPPNGKRQPNCSSAVLPASTRRL